MNKFYQRREKFEQIPELYAVPVSMRPLASLDETIPDEPNLQVYFQSEDQRPLTPNDKTFEHFREVASELGYELWLPQYFATGVARLVQADLIEPTTLDVVKGARKDMTQQYLRAKESLDDEFTVKFENGDPYILFARDLGRISLLDELASDHELRTILDDISRLELVIRYSNNRLRTIQQTCGKILSVITHSPLDRSSLTIDITNTDIPQTGSCAHSDVFLKPEDFTAANVKNSAVIFRGKLQARETAAHESGLIIANTLNAKNMPYHPIFHELKTRLEPRIRQLEADTLFDPMDLMYQVSFRLTCFRLEEIFDDYYGGFLQPDEYVLGQMNALNDYNLVRQFTGIDWNGYRLNEELIETLIGEQLLLAKERYTQTRTEVQTVLGRTGLLAMDGSHLINQEGRIFCVDDERNEAHEVLFKEIDPEQANDYHATYHYIHAPRASRSFGLFFAGEDSPFTIAGIDAVDRDYKKEALLLLGYDYENCVDFTRLYSLPGAPKLASSTISKLIKQRLLSERPNMQAAISTFMPTYANSNSMFACGFDKVFLLKRNRHRFVERTDLGPGVFEHLTNRRADGQTTISNRQVLLPVVELLSEIKKPRFKPYVDINRSMMIRPDTQ